VPNPAPTTLIVTFSATGSPQTLQIRPGTDYNNAVHNMFLYGGFWFVSSTGVQTFVPWNAISSITAQ
jgi:hypothetical protein